VSKRADVFHIIPNSTDVSGCVPGLLAALFSSVRFEAIRVRSCREKSKQRAVPGAGSVVVRFVSGSASRSTRVRPGSGLIGSFECLPTA